MKKKKKELYTIYEYDNKYYDKASIELIKNSKEKIFRIIKNTNHNVDGFPIYYIVENTKDSIESISSQILDDYDYRCIKNEERILFGDNFITYKRYMLMVQSF